MNIQLDHQEFELELTGKSIMRFEREAGVSFIKIGEQMTMSNIIILVWACLKVPMTVDELAEKIKPKDFEALAKAMEQLVGDFTKN
jgi:hypothetical protein